MRLPHHREFPVRTRPVKPAFRPGFLEKFFQAGCRGGKVRLHTGAQKLFVPRQAVVFIKHLAEPDLIGR